MGLELAVQLKLPRRERVGLLRDVKLVDDEPSSRQLEMDAADTVGVPAP